MIFPSTLGCFCDFLIDKFLILVFLFKGPSTASSFLKIPQIFPFWIYLILIHFLFFIRIKFQNKVEFTQ
jgi:hypothetical protein